MALSEQYSKRAVEMPGTNHWRSADSTKDHHVYCRPKGIRLNGPHPQEMNSHCPSFCCLYDTTGEMRRVSVPTGLAWKLRGDGIDERSVAIADRISQMTLESCAGLRVGCRSIPTERTMGA